MPLGTKGFWSSIEGLLPFSFLSAFTIWFGGCWHSSNCKIMSCMYVTFRKSYHFINYKGIITLPTFLPITSCPSPWSLGPWLLGLHLKEVVQWPFQSWLWHWKSNHLLQETFHWLIFREWVSSHKTTHYIHNIRLIRMLIRIS